MPAASPARQKSPIPDGNRCSAKDSSFVPITGVSMCSTAGLAIHSLDHLVGSGEQRWWNGDAKCLRSLEIDGQLVLCGCLHRQVGRFLTPKNTIHIRRRAPILIDYIGTIGDEAATADPKTF